jgi:hypothetical protein
MAGQTAYGRKVSFTSDMLSLTLEDAPEGLLDQESTLKLAQNGQRASRNRLNALSESDDVEANAPRNDDANSLPADSTLSRKRKRRIGVVSLPKLSREHHSQPSVSSDRMSPINTSFSHQHHRIRSCSLSCDSELKINPLIHVDKHPNGNACVLHVYQDEIADLMPDQTAALVQDFFDTVFAEDENGHARFVMGVVHNAVSYMPEMISYFNTWYPGTAVKVQSLSNKSAIETSTLGEFAKKVQDTYHHNTFQFGGLDQFSVVGVVHEEVGGYFPDILDMLEENPFLKAVLPWGALSGLNLKERTDSDDGPILWVRPGEQVLPLSDISRSQQPNRRRRAGIHELQNLQCVPRVSEPRETLIEDRTRCHADHFGQGPDRCTTAAVGVLKAVYTDEKPTLNRETKEVIAFHASDFSELVISLQLDLHEPPTTQVSKLILKKYLLISLSINTIVC